MLDSGKIRNHSLIRGTFRKYSASIPQVFGERLRKRCGTDAEPTQKYAESLTLAPECFPKRRGSVRNGCGNDAEHPEGLRNPCRTSADGFAETRVWVYKDAIYFALTGRSRVQCSPKANRRMIHICYATAC